VLLRSRRKESQYPSVARTEGAAGRHLPGAGAGLGAGSFDRARKKDSFRERFPDTHHGVAATTHIDPTDPLPREARRRHQPASGFSLSGERALVGVQRRGPRARADGLEPPSGLAGVALDASFALKIPLVEPDPIAANDGGSRRIQDRAESAVADARLIARIPTRPSARSSPARRAPPAETSMTATVERRAGRTPRTPDAAR